MSRMGDPDMASQAQGIKDKAAEMGQQLRDAGQHARQAAQEQYEHFRDQAEGYYQQGREKAEKWEQGIEQFVNEKPIQALMMAAGVGMLLGLLWKRH